MIGRSAGGKEGQKREFWAHSPLALQLQRCQVIPRAEFTRLEQLHIGWPIEIKNLNLNTFVSTHYACMIPQYAGSVPSE